MTVKINYSDKISSLLISLISLSFYHVASIGLGLTLFVGFPIGFICSLPLFALRYVVNKTGACFRPSLGKMVTARSAVFSASDKIHEKPKGSIIIRGTIEGDMSLSLLQEILQDQVLSAKSEDGQLKYPELQQLLTSFCGYHFWENDPHFNIKNHIREINPFDDENDGDNDKGKDNESLRPCRRVTDKELCKIQETLIHLPFERNKPVWEFVIVANTTLTTDPSSDSEATTKRYTTLFFRMHHSLSDGYSGLGLISEHFAQLSGLKNAMPSPVKRSWWPKIIFVTTFPFRWCFELAAAVVYPLTPFVSMPFKASREFHGGQMFLAVSQRINIAKIKDVKNHFKVPFMSVIFAAVSGALRDLMIQKGEKVPQLFPCICPLPLPGHTDKLRNYLGAGVPMLPTGLEDPISRLEYCSQDYNRLKRSTFGLSSMIGFMIMGSYWSWVTRLLVRNYFSSTWLTAFPGGLQQMSVRGMKMLDPICFVGLQKGTTGLGFCMISYLDGMRVTTTADASILTVDDVKELTNNIEKHIDILRSKIKQDV